MNVFGPDFVRFTVMLLDFDHCTAMKQFVHFFPGCFPLMPRVFLNLYEAQYASQSTVAKRPFDSGNPALCQSLSELWMLLWTLQNMIGMQ